MAFGKKGLFEGMKPMLDALNDSVKPIVSVVRGGAIGIGFTHLSLYGPFYEDYVITGRKFYINISINYG